MSHSWAYLSFVQVQLQCKAEPWEIIAYMDVRVRSDPTYLRACVATHMQGQKSLALLTSPVMSFHNKNPLTFIGNQRNGTETPPRYAKHLVWALHHFEGTWSSTYSSINDHYTPFQMFPCLMLHAHDNWLHQLGLDAAPPRIYFIFFSFQTSAKTCEGLSYWPCQSTAVQRMSRFDWFMPWHKSAWESSWEIQISGKAPRLQMDDVEGRWIQYLV